MAEEVELTPEEKLLKVIQKGEAAPAPPAVDVARDDEAHAASQSVITVGEPGRGIRLFNRLLAVAAVLFLLLAAYETVLNLPGDPVCYLPASLDLGSNALAPGTASLSDTLDMYAKRRIFGHPPPVENPDTNPPERGVTLMGWRAYVRENFSLMGLSDVVRRQNNAEQQVREAIVMDKKTRKMQFLKEGQVVMIEERDVLVSRIGDAMVEFRTGDEIQVLE